jgi:hypothetical protein
MVFLMETKLRKEKMDLIKYKLGFPNIFAVDSVGKSGGMALFGGSKVVVNVQNFSLQHINCSVETREVGSKWKFIGFYRHPVVAKWYKAWELLRYLAK